MRKVAFVALVAGWMALGIGSAQAAPRPPQSPTFKGYYNGQPDTGATFSLNISNGGKSGHSTGTVDSTGSPSNVFDLSDVVGKTPRVQTYTEICQDGHHIMVTDAVTTPSDNSCNNWHLIGGWYDLTGSTYVKIDSGFGTVDVTGGGSSTSSTGGGGGGGYGNGGGGDYPRFEFFGGFEYLDFRIKEEGSSSGGSVGVTTSRPMVESYNFAGFAGTAVYNVNSHLGVGFGYDYKSLFGQKGESGTIQLYGGVVKETCRHKWVDPFAEAQIGGARFSSGNEGINSFGMKLGGGLDINITPHIAFRPVQTDYVLTHFGGQTQNSVDAIAGLNIRF